MPIVVECPECHLQYRIAEKHVGRKAKCKNGHVFTIGQDKLSSSCSQPVSKDNARHAPPIEAATPQDTTAQVSDGTTGTQTIRSPRFDPLDSNPPWNQPGFQALCPYCKTELAGRKTPRRRSTFSCKSCKMLIAVEPNQYLYPTPYLNELQAGYVYYLWQLDHWCFTKGSRQDYEKMRSALRVKFKGEPGIGDVIWGLMNLSVRALAEEHAQGIADLMKLGMDKGFIKDQRKLHPEMDDLRTLMNDFKEFEKKHRKKAHK